MKSNEKSDLAENCEKINKCLEELKQQRDELEMLIKKQQEERENLLLEIEKYKYKVNTISKSIEQKLQTKSRCDKAISQSEEVYKNLVASSKTLVGNICKEVGDLAFSNDKKIGTDPPSES